jgi:hypothetical protein
VTSITIVKDNEPCTYSFQGQLDKSFRWIEVATDRALNVRPEFLDASVFKVFKVCPFLASVREDPRWDDWLVRIEERISANKT